MVTVRVMPRIGNRHLDTRRNLKPRDYFENPWTFGVPSAQLVLPPGGDEVSQRIALQTHRLVCRLRERSVTSSRACERFGFSRDVWSEVCAGQRWPGETVLAAIIDTLATTDGR
ncbi:MAG: hypothetical protein RI958_996 [Actinomycetota bacterium]